MNDKSVGEPFTISEHHVEAQKMPKMLHRIFGSICIARFKYYIASILSRISFPVAILGGCAITAGTTYALVHWVQHLIATAAVNSDPGFWVQEARTMAYEACYNGCNNCSDASYAYKGCAMTAKANLTGVICDGNIMWNWEDRYPDVCLQ